MSWHCSLEPGVVFLLQDYLDGLRSRRARSSRSRGTSCSSGNATGTWSSSLFGTMCGRSTASRGEDSSMSSAGDSPAKTSALRVTVEDLPETVRAFGSSICASLKKLGLALSSRKTVRSCVPVALAPSSKDLTAWGMTCGGACWELGTSVPFTNAPACGYWLSTASARDWKDTPGMSTARPDGKGNRLDQLPRQVFAMERGWLPTPAATSYGSNGNAPGEIGPRRKSLQSLAREGRAGGQLNMAWVEWLMGWPIGWTERKPLATGRFQSWLQLHGAS